MPQAKFLEFVTGHARRYPYFRLLMGAQVRELIMEEGVVSRGVRYWDETGVGRWPSARGAMRRWRQRAAKRMPLATSAQPR